MTTPATTPPASTARLNRRLVARATSVVMALFVLSRVLGLLRESVIARQFGDMPEYAAYLAAFRLPDLLFNLVAGGALASAFIPTLSDYLVSGRREEGWRLASAVGNWLFIGLGTLAVIAGIAAPWIVQTAIAPGFEPGLIRLTVALMRVMLVSTLIFSLSGLLMGILHAHDHFVIPALAPVLYNVGILTGALFLSPSMGVYGLAAGVVLGAALHALVQVPVLRARGFRYWRSLGREDPEINRSVRQVARLMGPRVLGAAVVQLMFVANTIIASFYDPAVLAALNYAWIVMLLPHGVFASSLATTIFPTFSRMAAAGDRDGMRATMARIIRALLFLVLPSAVGLFVLRTPIVQLLFERGAFTAQTTAAVAWALAFYSLGLVPHSLVEVINRAYFALKDTRTPVAIGVGAMVLNIALSIVLVRVIGEPSDLSRGPQGGLALANSIASSLEIIFLVWWLRPKMGGLALRRIADGGVRMGVAAGLMGLLLFALEYTPAAALSPWLFVPLAVLLGAASYLTVTLLLGVEEARSLPALVLRRG